MWLRKSLKVVYRTTQQLPFHLDVSESALVNLFNNYFDNVAVFINVLNAFMI
jgi:hypothetical protein